MNLWSPKNLGLALCVSLSFIIFAQETDTALTGSTFSGILPKFCYRKRFNYKFDLKVQANVCPKRTTYQQCSNRKKLDKNTRRQLQRLYSGLFKTKRSIRRNQLAQRTSRSVSVHDGDVHCPTIREMQQLPSCMMDAYGRMQEIVHFPEDYLYQRAEIGKCAPVSQQSCRPNHGDCYLDKVIVYVLVWDYASSFLLSFQPFEMGGYCSCKNIGQG